MKRILSAASALLLCTFCSTPSHEDTHIVMETTAGAIELRLYDETPQHRDNFIKLVEDGIYDSLLFHRVIRDFMIQGGDPQSKSAFPGEVLGEGDLGYTVPAEICIDKGIYHRRGVLAAAREGDEVNPKRASSASQFYIVWGHEFDDETLDYIVEKTFQRTGIRLEYTDEMRETYKTVGGTPHLDGQYTVFGEVVSGLEVVDSIQHVATDLNDRPVQDVRILKAYVKEKEEL